MAIERVPFLIVVVPILALLPVAPIPADECPDALITAGVKTRLATDDLIGVFKINVDTDECIVTLNGCVESKEQAKRARKLAAKVGKVKEVRSNLTICPKKD
jgi:osmotically-inducible protein OsmY